MTWIGLVLLVLGASPYQVWQEVYDGGKVDMGHGLCLDSSGHVVVVGETNQALDYDSWTIALSKDGDSLWSLLYDDGHDEKGFSIAATHEGNIAVATGINQSAVQINLYDPNGELLWERLNLADEIVRIIATTDNRIYILGEEDHPPSDYEILVTGYNEKGDTVLYLDILVFDPGASDLVVDPLGYIYIGLYKSGPCTVWAYSPEAKLVWFQNNGDTATKAFALEMNGANHLFQAGYFGDGTHFDFLLLKWNSITGILIWPEHKAYDLGANEYCHDLKLDSISDCYLAGWQDRGDEDVALVKTDSAGNMLWAWVDTVEGKQEIEGIEIDEDGYIYLAGSHYNGENWDMLVMKVRQPLTIRGLVTDSTGKAMKDIPVALTGDTTVEVQTDAEGYYTIEVYNGGNYTLSPKLPGWAFTPSSRTYSPLAHREWDQDFENGRWTGIAEASLPLGFDLEVTDNLILYQVPYATHMKIGVYDVSGRFVYEVVNGKVESGKRCFDLKDCSKTLASGVYFVKMITDDYKKTVKVVILE